MTDSYNQGGINLLACGGRVLPTLAAFASLNGDGATFNANGNYSGGPVEFYAAPPPGQTWVITQLTIQIVDSGAFGAGFYGNGIVLTNGIRVVHTYNPLAVPTSIGQIDLTPDFPVKTNSDWVKYTNDYWLAAFGAGNDSLTITMNFGGNLIQLNGDNRQRLSVIVNDNLTGLVQHTFNVKGAITRGLVIS